MIWKILFSILGLGSLAFILQGYGLNRILDDVTSLGWWTAPLALSFLPVLVCYAWAWLILTPELRFSQLPTMTRLTAISVAWNNISPFVKMLGEPVRVVLLGKTISQKSALKSVVLYNLVHTLGTLLAFVLGAVLILVIYPVSDSIRFGFLSLILVALLLSIFLFYLPHLSKSMPRVSLRWPGLMRAGFWLRWSFSKMRIFSKQYPARFWSAVMLEVAARFVEGLTFYLAFKALGENVSIIHCALLDVGRALMDNVFFFVPYQVGSREAGIVLLADRVMQLGQTSAVTAAILYRLVEIFWMCLGYIFWIMAGKSLKAVK